MVLAQALCPLLLTPRIILFVVAEGLDIALYEGLFGVVYWLSRSMFLLNPLVDALAALYLVPPYRKALLDTMGLKQKKTKVIRIHRGTTNAAARQTNRA